MGKKRIQASMLRQRLIKGMIIVFALCFLFCVFALVSFHSHSRQLASAVAVAARRPSVGFSGTAKIAFLFLARSNLPLDFLWKAFFQNGDERKFSIFIHSKPGFVFDQSTTKCSYFYGRQLKQSVQVAWGEASMIEAEKLLLATALHDPANQRFILLSDSCVPLYNFSYMYDYIMSSSKSFVDSFLDTKEDRYNSKMSPSIPKDRWRKGSQWITLVRKHAEFVAYDDLVFPIFKKYCKRIPPSDHLESLNPQRFLKKEHDCVPDEHYMQTLLAMGELEDELERRTLTYTSWNQSGTNMDSGGWHPITFKFKNASPVHIKQIKSISHVYYETEYRTEWCKSNGTFVPCFLFARKFSKGAAARLLSDAIVGPFDPVALLHGSKLVDSP